MKFSVPREGLLEPLQLVTGVVERRQTLPILSNLLVVADDGGISLTGTDQEVELCAKVSGVQDCDPGEVTIPARKLLDICRSLAEGADVNCALGASRVSIQSGRFKSQLATLPASDFPKVEMGADVVSLTLSGNDLERLVAKCSFAMAQQDVRYFFNGMLIELESGLVRTVATNGQRMAISFIEADTSVAGKQQFIVPRKGVIELARLIPSGDTPVELHFSQNHMRAIAPGATLTTKLIDGVYPDYTRAIPASADKRMVGDRREIREALGRTAILSNEVYRNVRLLVSPGKLEVHANNPLQEEAEETISVAYDGEALEIGFNVGYLVDVLGVMEGEKVAMDFSDASSAALFTDSEDEKSRFVISPMML